jgi:hypothetical protein
MPPILHYLYARCGRSEGRLPYARHVPGPPIRSLIPYSFADALMHENQLVMDREDADPIYRGDVFPFFFATSSNFRLTIH